MPGEDEVLLEACALPHPPIQITMIFFTHFSSSVSPWYFEKDFGKRDRQPFETSSL